MSPLPDPIDAAESPRALAELNAWLAGRTATQRIAWGLETLAGNHALTSSFGAQAAVSLHLATRVRPDLPVVLLDTGYLFPETYRFVDELVHRLDLDLHVFKPEPLAAARARIDKPWERGVAGLDAYHRTHKLEPMRRALDALGVRTWLAGLRRVQSDTRDAIDFLELRDGRWKLHPIADWTDRDVGRHLAAHGLPYHPLWDEGYVSIGDTHSTRRWEPGMRTQDTRFGGLRRECGLHFDLESGRAA
jgi:phosphoadenosine phosphosulfate reductase